jgi:hypothetical protein
MSSSAETDSRSTIQRIPWLLWNPKVYYPAQNSPPLKYILSQFNSVYTHTQSRN